MGLVKLVDLIRKPLTQGLQKVVRRSEEVVVERFQWQNIYHSPVEIRLEKEDRGLLAVEVP